MSKIVANKYVPTYQDYYKLPWYEREMMPYTDYLKFKDVRVVDFDIINNECRDDTLADTYEVYKMLKNEHLTNFPKEKAKRFLLAAFRNKRDDLWVYDLFTL